MSFKHQFFTQQLNVLLESVMSAIVQTLKENNIGPDTNIKLTNTDRFFDEQRDITISFNTEGELEWEDVSINGTELPIEKALIFLTCVEEGFFFNADLTE